MADEKSQSRDALFASVLKTVLRPLVRVLIARGVTAPTLYRLLKTVYVEVAEQDFALDGQRPTDTRINLLTGVHRKDIRAMREAEDPEAAARGARANVMASLIGRWLADPDLTDSAGRPIPLLRQPQESGPSFESLARAVSTDMRPRTLLDELLAQGLVTLDDAGRVVELHPEALVGPADYAQRVHFFVENLADHIEAAGANLAAEGSEPPFLERAVFYNRLTPASVAAIENMARSDGGALLAAINRLAFARQEADADAPEDMADERFRFGIYFYRAPEAEVEPEPEPEPRADGVSGDEGDGKDG